MKKLREVVIVADRINKENKDIVRAIDFYNPNRRYLVKFNSDIYTVKVSGNEKIDENVNDYLMTHTEDLEKKKIDRKKILKEFDVFEEIVRPKENKHEYGTRIKIRLGKIINEN